jgi:16S rRNA (guanine527-N7)-methyltransferase
MTRRLGTDRNPAGRALRNDFWRAELLKPYGLNLDPAQTSQVIDYLELLIRWNSHINLVAAASPEVWMRRHFAESLYISQFMSLNGRVLDVGSGAGFPVLPLKIMFPQIQPTLLEPVGKKRAFLKEVVRVCGLSEVEMRPERLEDFDADGKLFDVVTSRAVGHFYQLIPQMAGMLREGGKILLWVSARQWREAEAASERVEWEPPILIPDTTQSYIARGVKGWRVLPNNAY